MNVLEFSEVLKSKTFIVTATCNLSQEETLRHDLFLPYSMFKMYLLYRIFKTLDSEIEDKINIFEFRLLLQLWADVKRQGHGTFTFQNRLLNGWHRISNSQKI